MNAKPETPTDFRHNMVEKLKAEGFITDSRVAQAMRTVPRHHFGHWLSLETVHARGAHALPGATEATMSTISDPAAVAIMLEPLELQRGQRVLEVGAGTGYNAALIAELVGETGHVTSVDIEPYVVAAAKTNLQATGYGRVEVILGDGGFGFAKNAPYDCIMATVGLWEIPLEWFTQLAHGGRIAAPLHISGEPLEHMYVVLSMEGEHLTGRVTSALNMVLMRGAAGAHPATPTQSHSAEGVIPKTTRVKVYRRDDPDAPAPHALEVTGGRATKVLEKTHTVIALEIEVQADAGAGLEG